MGCNFNITVSGKDSSDQFPWHKSLYLENIEWNDLEKQVKCEWPFCFVYAYRGGGMKAASTIPVQALVNFFCKRPDSKYSQLCGP